MRRSRTLPQSGAPVLLALLWAGLATLAPSPASAQLTLSGSCAPGGGCGVVRFVLRSSSPSPLSIFLLSLSLSSGSPLAFAATPGATANAEDSLSPLFGPISGTFETATPFDVAVRFGTNPGDVGFELTDLPPDIRPNGFVDVPVTGSGPSSFSFLVTDADGAQILGTGDILVGSTVPEPMSSMLLGTGLAGLAAFRRRQRREG